MRWRGGLAGAFLVLTGCSFRTGEAVTIQWINRSDTPQGYALSEADGDSWGRIDPCWMTHLTAEVGPLWSLRVGAVGPDGPLGEYRDVLTAAEAGAEDAVITLEFAADGNVRILAEPPPDFTSGENVDGCGAPVDAALLISFRDEVTENQAADFGTQHGLALIRRLRIDEWPGSDYFAFKVVDGTDVGEKQTELLRMAPGEIREVTRPRPPGDDS